MNLLERKIRDQNDLTTVKVPVRTVLHVGNSFCPQLFLLDSNSAVRSLNACAARRQSLHRRTAKERQLSARSTMTKAAHEPNGKC